MALSIPCRIAVVWQVPCFFFQAEDGIRDLRMSRGLGDVYKRQVGDVVESGQDVIVIESMKMEIPVVSNVSGTVVSIFVVEGEMVDEDQKLIELNTKD